MAMDKLDQHNIIIIPARLASMRLPNKPLADIAGKPMIVRVYEKAIAANIGEVIVAAAEQEIVDAVEKAGGKAILTDPSHPSGSDRIYEALIKTGKNYLNIINLQGDLPNIDPLYIKKITELLDKGFEIATLAAPISDEAEKDNPNIVKLTISKSGRALYFSRSRIPYGANAKLYHHIGIYGYKTIALKKFVNLPASELELCERLEQLRALENDMQIGVEIVDKIPIGVDTIEELEKIRQLKW